MTNGVSRENGKIGISTSRMKARTGRPGRAFTTVWFLVTAVAVVLCAFLFHFSGTSDPVRIGHLEAILIASLGWPQRRAGFDADSAAIMGLASLDLQKITCPTLIMHGTADTAVPPENARHAHASIPGSELYWMRGSHVAFFLEEGDTAQPYALEWLQRQVRNGLGP